MEEKKELLDQDERVVEIELERLRGFVNHPFKVQADSQMIELQESIKKYGILNPLIVRPRQDGTYEIISGHRRKFAAEKIGYRKVLFFYHKRRNEMSYKLVIAEKPSVAQSIAKVIGADKREDGYLEGNTKTTMCHFLIGIICLNTLCKSRRISQLSFINIITKIFACGVITAICSHIRHIKGFFEFR